MSKKHKFFFSILIIIGIIGTFLMIEYGNQIIRPISHVIDEEFIRQCSICYVLSESLRPIFVGMVAIPLVIILGLLNDKYNKTGTFFICACLCFLFAWPIPSAVKVAKGDVICQEYVIRHKETKEHKSPLRGRSWTERIIWLKDGAKLHASLSVYDSVEVGDDVYVVYSGNTIINVFPVGEYGWGY